MPISQSMKLCDLFWFQPEHCHLNNDKPNPFPSHLTNRFESFLLLSLEFGVVAGEQRLNKAE